MQPFTSEAQSVARRHIYLADGSLAPRRSRRRKQRPICRSCGEKFATTPEASAHRRRTHGPYTYKGFALRQDEGTWYVVLPDDHHPFETRSSAREFINKRLGVRHSVYTVSGGLPTLGKRR